MPESLYRILLFSGSDRQSFLQGQLTQDLDKLHDAISLPAAWCNAKGRVIVTCRLLDLGNSIGLALPELMAASVVQRLLMYRLRADVTIINEDTSWKAIAVFGDQNLERLNQAGLLPGKAVSASCRSGGLITVNQVGTSRYVEIFGQEYDIEAIGLNAQTSLSVDQWRDERIAGGLVDIHQDNSERYTPHMLNLDLTGAISFTKGCYTGQEVVARTEHLGSVKRRLMRYRKDEAIAKIGDKLTSGDREVGTVVNTGTSDLLAITAVAGHAEVLSLESHRVTSLPLPYNIHSTNTD